MTRNSLGRGMDVNFLTCSKTGCVRRSNVSSTTLLLGYELGANPFTMYDLRMSEYLSIFKSLSFI